MDMDNNTPLSNAALLAALRRVLDYAQEDEERDWQEQGRPDFHIVHDMRALRAWVDGES